MTINEIRNKYAIDSKGSFGKEKNPIEKSKKRKNAYNEEVEKNLLASSQKRSDIEASIRSVNKAIEDLSYCCGRFPLLVKGIKFIKDGIARFKRVYDMEKSRNYANNKEFIKQHESRRH